MKRFCLVPCAIALVLSACNSTQPLSGGDFDPFVAPGMNKGGVGVAAKGIKNGTFVRTIMDNAAFFSKRPGPGSQADKMLKKNTEMKVISDDQSYVKVELNSGEVGFIPTVQVSDEQPGAGPGALPPVQPINSISPGAVQVYPPLPGATLPPVKPSPETPALPPVIDPDQPAPALPAPAPVAPAPATPPPVEKETTDGQ